MLIIRLSRVGKKNMPLYRLIISEKTKDLVGDSLEILGSYNPHSKELIAKEDRIKYWISKGAAMSATVNNILAVKKVIATEKIKVDVIRTKRKEKK
jgi:small subunit ribosomal protein S16